MIQSPLVDALDDKDGGEGEKEKSNGEADEILEDVGLSFIAHQQLYSN